MSELSPGVRACMDALNRLVRGVPVIAAHIDLPIQKITAGVVSVEAGFDRGYLKKSRLAHRSLILQIEHAKALGEKTRGGSDFSSAKRERRKIASLEEENKTLTQQRDEVIVQNLRLYERLQSLETEISKFQTKII